MHGQHAGQRQLNSHACKLLVIFRDNYNEPTTWPSHEHKSFPHGRRTQGRQARGQGEVRRHSFQSAYIDRAKTAPRARKVVPLRYMS